MKISMSTSPINGHFPRSPVAAAVTFADEVCIFGVLAHGSGEHWSRWRYGGVSGEPFQVLDGGGQQKLVAGASEAPQTEPDHRENILGLAEEP